MTADVSALPPEQRLRRIYSLARIADFKNGSRQCVSLIYERIFREALEWEYGYRVRCEASDNLSQNRNYNIERKDFYLFVFAGGLIWFNELYAELATCLLHS